MKGWNERDGFIDLHQKPSVARSWLRPSDTYPENPHVAWHLGTPADWVDTIRGVTLTPLSQYYGELIQGIPSVFFPNQAAYIRDSPAVLRFQSDWSATIIYFGDDPSIGAYSQPGFLFGYGAGLVGTSRSNWQYSVGVRNGELYYRHDYDNYLKQSVTTRVHSLYQSSILTTVREDNRISWYLNGDFVYGPSAQLNPTSGGDGVYPNDCIFCIGSCMDVEGTSYNFYGSISDLTMYNRALTPTEVVTQHRTVMRTI